MTFVFNLLDVGVAGLRCAVRSRREQTIFQVLWRAAGPWGRETAVKFSECTAGTTVYDFPGTDTSVFILTTHLLTHTHSLLFLSLSHTITSQQVKLNTQTHTHHCVT